MLDQRFGSARLLAASLVIAVVGMALLGRVTADTSYLTGVALPMILIGIGQGGALGPLTRRASRVLRAAMRAPPPDS